MPNRFRHASDICTDCECQRKIHVDLKVGAYEIVLPKCCRDTGKCEQQMREKANVE